MICLYKAMPKHLWMIHTCWGRHTSTCHGVALRSVLHPICCKVEIQQWQRWRTTRDLHTLKHFKNLFSFSVPRTTQTTKGFPSKQISCASALGAVPAHAKQRKCSSIFLHTTLCYTRRWWWGGLCQEELSSHCRKDGRRKHTLVTPSYL